MSKKSLSNSNPSTYITQIKEGSVINGNMKSAHSIRVDGFVTGDLVSDERIIIGAHGEIEGNLKGTDIAIDGYIKGNIISDGHLQLSNSSRIYGDIFAKEISIAHGAELNGKVIVGKSNDVPAHKPSDHRKLNSSESKNAPLEEKFGNLA